MLPKGQHSVCWYHTQSKKAMGHRLLHLSTHTRTAWACGQCVCIWRPLKQPLCPPCLCHCWLWWHSHCFHAHAHERTQFPVSLSNVRDWRHSHQGLAKQDALCAAVLPQSPQPNWCCWVLSREVTTALVWFLYGAGQISGVCAHTDMARGACKGIWNQRSPSSQCSQIPEVSPVISIQLHAFDLGKSHPKPCPLLVRKLQGNGWGSTICPGSTYLAGHWCYLCRSFKNDTSVIWCVHT